MKYKYLQFKAFVFTILFTCISLLTYSQRLQYGTALIQNYSPVTYKAAPENYSVVQDNSGLIYFGNVGFVMEYDGVNWRYIEVKKDQPIYSLAKDSAGTIFVSAGKEFGFLAPDSRGLLQYYSLSATIDSTTTCAEDIGKVLTTQNSIIYLTDQYIYEYTSEDIEKCIENREKLQSSNIQPITTKSKTSFSNIFYVMNKLYVQESLTGIQIYKKGKLEYLPHIGQFKDNKVVSILPLDKNRILLATNKGMFYYLFGIGIGVFKTETDKYLDEIEILAAEALNNSYAFSTINKGTVVIEKGIEGRKRKILEKYDKLSGLPSEQITSIYNNPALDADQLWLTSYYGISQTKVSSAMRKMVEANTVKDIIQDLHYFEKTIYLRTVGEIYFMKDTAGAPEFKKVNDISMPNNWLVTTIQKEKETKKIAKIARKIAKTVIKKIKPPLINKEVLLTATNKGVFAVNSNNSEEIKFEFATNKNQIIKFQKPKFEYLARDICAADSVKGRFYIAGKSGVMVIAQNEGKWLLDRNIPNVKEIITNLCTDGNDNLWLATKNGYLLKVGFPNKSFQHKKYSFTRADTIGFPLLPENIEIKKFGEKEGILKLVGKGIYCLNKKIYCSTQNGIFVYDTRANKFVEEKSFNACLNTYARVLDMTCDYKGNIWIRTQTAFSSEICVFEKQSDGTYKSQQNSFRAFPKMTIQAIYPAEDGLIWIAGTDGLFYYNSKQKQENNSKFSALIRKVSISSDSVLFYGSRYINKEGKRILVHNQDISSIPNLKFESNYIRFEYAAPFFDNEDATLYSYMLVGYDKEWTTFTKNTYKEFMNLPFGTYTFQVKAKNVYGKESEIASYEFSILRPFYEKWWFYLLEIGSFVFLLGTSIFLNRKGMFKKLTPIITMITVTAIFKMFGGLVLAPIIGLFISGVVFFKILSDTIIGALLFPTWTYVMNLITHGSFKKPEEAVQKESNDTEEKS